MFIPDPDLDFLPIPDPDLDFLPIPDPGVKKASDPGSGAATLSQSIIRIATPPSVHADPQSCFCYTGTGITYLAFQTSSLSFIRQCYHELPTYASLLRVKNWRIPEAELLSRLRSLHQQAQQSSSSSGEQEQEQAEAELTRKGRPKKNKKEALFIRAGFKAITMEQIQGNLTHESFFFFFLHESYVKKN
jgi:hypothetical protein